MGWLNDTASILPHLQGKLLSLEHYDSWMSRITSLAGAESVAAAFALRNLKTYADDAIRLIFATGCMVLPSNFSAIDPHSSEHARKYFYGGPLKKFLRALKKTKTKATELMNHLDAINDGDGHPEQGKL